MEGGARPVAYRPSPTVAKLCCPHPKTAPPRPLRRLARPARPLQRGARPRCGARGGYRGLLRSVQHRTPPTQLTILLQHAITTVPQALLSWFTKPAALVLTLLHRATGRGAAQESAATCRPLLVLKAKGLLRPGTMTLLISPPGHVRGSPARHRLAAGRSLPPTRGIATPSLPYSHPKCRARHL